MSLRYGALEMRKVMKSREGKSQIEAKIELIIPISRFGNPSDEGCIQHAFCVSNDASISGCIESLFVSARICHEGINQCFSLALHTHTERTWAIVYCKAMLYYAGHNCVLPKPRDRQLPADVWVPLGECRRIFPSPLDSRVKRRSVFHAETRRG